MTTPDGLEALKDKPIVFWTCLQPDHLDVDWEGDIATCRTCGLTSQMTRLYVDAVRRSEQRRLDKAGQVVVSRADLVAYLNRDGVDLRAEVDALNRLLAAAGIE